ncbi:uncharacterized protein K02A2.6-like [Hydractinia symbiolongicarpus]|uniref:uncharacterized protein K02A2.6-like n=1 Tax=Hydractinia symbiolongicarpus TaxID=13093 RepID=UPI00254DD361|nr:uncharacterized protein K02A2.6-like [Hydractinia symbiolongicarpus]
MWGSRVIIPSSLRPQLLGQFHQSHTWITGMKSLARSFVRWSKMDSEIELTVKNCKTCEIHQKMPDAAPIHSWKYPSQPWERIHMDYAGLFLNKMFLIVVDAFSK